MASSHELLVPAAGRYQFHATFVVKEEGVVVQAVVALLHQYLLLGLLFHILQLLVVVCLGLPHPTWLVAFHVRPLLSQTALVL